MKPISEQYPLLGHDFSANENFDEIYALAKKIVDIVLLEKRSYAEACEAFSIAKKGLESIPYKA